MANIMFKVGNVDYTDNVIASDYVVGSYPEYQTWTDANGHEHRSSYRTRVYGTLELYFFTMKEFNDFQDNMALVKQNDLTCPVTVYDNNTAAEVTINAFVDYTPSRYRGADRADYIAQLAVTIREQ